MHEHSKFLLADSQIPSIWVNVLPSLPEPMAPPLNPQTRAPLTPEDLAPIFPMELIQQEFSPQPEIDIPGAPSRKGARHPGAYLLQVRRHQPGGQP
jgi:tryptophan synthase beta chain